MYAEILVEIRSKHIDKTFTYHVPKELEPEIAIGKRVLVLFGSQKIEGYVLGLKNESDIETKDILEVLDTDPVLNDPSFVLDRLKKA